MATRKTSRPRDAISLAGETNVGNQSIIFNDQEVLQLLKSAVEREGNQGAFARRHGIGRTHLNRILNRKKPVVDSVLKPLGLRKVYAPE
jgi:DNA-binding phage protein